MSVTLHSPDGTAGSGNTPSWQEAMSAITSEAASSYDADVAVGEDSDQPADDSDATDDVDNDESEGDPDEATVDDADEAADEGEDVDEIKGWDGNPDSIPAKFKPAFEKAVGSVVEKRLAEIDKGVQKRLRQIADTENQYRAELTKLQAMQVQMMQGGKPGPGATNGAPEPPAEDASPREWDSYYDARTKWNAKQMIQEMVASGQLVTADQVHGMTSAVEQKRNADVARIQMVEQQDGYTEEIGLAMSELAKNSKTLGGLLFTDEGILDLFALAKERVTLKGSAKQTADARVAEAAKAEANARRKAQAGNNALPRPGSMRQAAMNTGVPNDGKPRTVEQRMALIVEQQKNGG